MWGGGRINTPCICLFLRFFSTILTAQDAFVVLVCVKRWPIVTAASDFNLKTRYNKFTVWSEES